jgi:hypothetical protein
MILRPSRKTVRTTIETDFSMEFVANVLYDHADKKLPGSPRLYLEVVSGNRLKLTQEHVVDNVFQEDL